MDVKCKTCKDTGRKPILKDSENAWEICPDCNAHTLLAIIARLEDYNFGAKRKLIEITKLYAGAVGTLEQQQTELEANRSLDGQNKQLKTALAGCKKLAENSKYHLLTLRSKSRESVALNNAKLIIQTVDNHEEI